MKCLEANTRKTVEEAERATVSIANIIQNEQVNIAGANNVTNINQPAEKKWVKSKRKLTIQNHPTAALPSITATGEISVNNINNGQNQTNTLHVVKRRRLPIKGKAQQKSNNNEDAAGPSNDNEDDENDKNDDTDELEESHDSLDNSFNSVDKHPKTTHYYNYFAGKGQEEWKTGPMVSPATNPNNNHLAKIIQEYRKDSVKAAKRLENISDCSILSLSFVFPFSNQNLHNSFTISCKQHHLLFKNCSKSLHLELTPDNIVKWCHRVDSTYDINNDDMLKQTMQSMKEDLSADLSETEDVHASIVQRLAKEIRFWNIKNTEDGFMVYLYFFTDEVFSIVRCPLLNIHRTMKHLESEPRYKPDLKISYEYKDRQELDLCIIEVKKKSDISYTPSNSDYIKIHLEMKSMIDKMIRMNIDDPVVYGLLIEGFNCQVFRMSLDDDGFYFSPVVNYFHLSRDILDIMIIPKVTSIFISLKNELEQLVDRIQKKQKGKSSLLPWTRPSYDMPLLLKDPLQYILDNE